MENGNFSIQVLSITYYTEQQNSGRIRHPFHHWKIIFWNCLSTFPRWMQLSPRFYLLL